MRRNAAVTAIAFSCVFLGGVCGFALRSILFQSNETSAGKIRLHEGVPDVQQSTDYSCGAAALQAVLGFWGMDSDEQTLMQALRTNENSGTSPENILRVARELGFEAYARENMDLRDLKEAVDRTPLICAIQAWPDTAEAKLPWNKRWEAGHYVVVIGTDEDNIYVEDPSLQGTRGFIQSQEFLERWHDYEGDPPFDPGDRVYSQMCITIIGKNRPVPRAFTRVE